jgi:hypothetical protein
MRNILSPRPRGRRRAVAWAAWPAAGIVLALIAAGAPAAYAASGTAAPAPSSRSGTPATLHKTAKGTQDLCVLNMPYAAPTWMHDIAPCLEYRKLSEIAIPGSHDSGTYAFNFFQDGGFATTQDENFTAQLNDGMRSFDIRVDYQPAQPGIAAGWYVYHGPIHSSYETLHNIFTQIYNWAVQPAHANEIIRLSLDIEGGDDVQDCGDFGREMGHVALLTPDELQNQFHTNNPGEVTVGQLWSLADPRKALVIMTNIRCLNEAILADAGQWADSAGYFAEQCSADGIAGSSQYGQQYGVIIRLLGAVSAGTRLTEGPGSATPPPPPPIPYGPPAPPNNLYELDAQLTPEKNIDCAFTPLYFVEQDNEVLLALYNASGTLLNLNIVHGDFVEKTVLLGELLVADTQPRLPSYPLLSGVSHGTANQLTADFDPPASYGTAPVTFYTVTATPIDPGLQTKTVSGNSSPLTVTGLANQGTYTVTVTATNPYGTSPPSAPQTIEVGARPRLVVLPADTGIVGQPYDSKFVATGSGLLTFTLIKGNLPPGLNLINGPKNGTAPLTGTPTTAGSYKFDVKVVNAVGADASQATITIANPTSAQAGTGRR